MELLGIDAAGGMTFMGRFKWCSVIRIDFPSMVYFQRYSVDESWLSSLRALFGPNSALGTQYSSRCSDGVYFYGTCNQPVRQKEMCGLHGFACVGCRWRLESGWDGGFVGDGFEVESVGIGIGSL